MYCPVPCFFAAQGFCYLTVFIRGLHGKITDLEYAKCQCPNLTILFYLNLRFICDPSESILEQDVYNLAVEGHLSLRSFA